MHCLKISSPKILLLYQLPETELMRVKTVMDSNFPFLRRVILINPIIFLLSTYSFHLRVLILFVLGYTTLLQFRDDTQPLCHTELSCAVLQEKQSSNPREHTSSASTAKFGNMQHLIAYLRESQLYVDQFIYTLLQLDGDKPFLFNFLKIAPEV